MNDKDNQAPYQSFTSSNLEIRAFTKGVPFETEALKQLQNIASLPIVFHHVAAMPDVHLGIGATVGSVVATKHAIIPAAVGVDIGCGMMAVKTSLQAKHLPDNLHAMRTAIEKAVPHGRTNNGGSADRGAWKNVPDEALKRFAHLREGFQRICEVMPQLHKSNHVNHLGTLGTGNHFIEVCLDEADHVWVMLHSGSRGVGNAIGTNFIELAKKDAERLQLNLPDRDLAYFQEGARHFDDYVHAVSWAQDFARENRTLMMHNVLKALRKTPHLREFTDGLTGKGEVAVNCHHNYVEREQHYGEDVFVTRKGAVRARTTDLGIIPGSMGAKSFIVRGKGNPDSFCSCSHGAGRSMSRGEAKRRFTVEDHKRDTAHVECRKDVDVIDETPKAYKDIERVMQAQSELVDVVHTLRQVVCVKG